MNDAMSATNASRAENPHKIRRITPRQREQMRYKLKKFILVPRIHREPVN